jgi:hypothetical protein
MQTEATPTKRNRVPVKISLLIIAVISVAFIWNHLANPVPQAFKVTMGFTVFYADTSRLPGYKYSGNVRSSGNIFSFELSNNGRLITVNEQTAPKHNIGLNTLAGFDPFETPNGTAYTGKNKSSPVALIITKGTLINVTGMADVPADVINSLVKSLKPVK